VIDGDIHKLLDMRSCWLLITSYKVLGNTSYIRKVKYLHLL
jgi:hypothetical protein